MTTDPQPGRRATSGLSIGVDAGATLAKIAVQADGQPVRFELLLSADTDAVLARMNALEPTRIGLTGGGASGLAARLGTRSLRVDEFEAWHAGADKLLGQHDLAESGSYLLVSLGTGTSALLVDNGSVKRVGGTALGGGTLTGLGAALLGSTDFQEVCSLAGRGRRGRVDLLVSDIYRKGEIELPGDITAASFGKLGREHGVEEPPEREDLAAAVVGLVGENVGLICGGLAAAAKVRRIVYGGSTLRGNRALGRVLEIVSAAMGQRTTLLPDGEFVGALGALELARRDAPV